MTDFLLQPPPSGNDIATGGRITSWRDMEGKTIKAAIEHPCGAHGADADVVLVFEDGTWATAAGQPDGSESAYIQLGSDFGYHRKLGLVDYLHPHELLGSGLINQGQYEHLMEQTEARERAAKEAKRARLLAEAEKLAREL